MKKLTRLILSLALFLILAPAPVVAADPQPAGGDPDPTANLILAQFMQSGARVFFLGYRNGMNGWFVVKDNQIQIIYSPPDNQVVFVGAMFDNHGENITSQQIKIVYDNNKELHAFLSAYNATPNTQAQPGMGTMQQQPGVMPGSLPQMGQNAYGQGMAGQYQTQQPPLLPTASPGERLIQSLLSADGVNLGAPAAPKLYMIADPNCPHCQATWKAIRAAVFGGKLQIRLVPIDAVDPDSGRASAQLLRSPTPLEAWDKYIAGDHAQLAGTPDIGAVTAIRNNHALADAWHIQMTPYMAYRAKDGQIKILQGEPDHPDALIDDIAAY